MPTCKDCEFYKPIDKKRGDCFGHEVPAERAADKCPQKAFKPRK